MALVVLDPSRIEKADGGDVCIGKVGAAIGRREHDGRTVVLMAQAAGIEKPPSPHWLRHTFGTLTAMVGAGA